MQTADKSAEFVVLRVRRKAGAGDVSVSGAVTKWIRFMWMMSFVQTAEKAPQTAQRKLHCRLRLQQSP